MDLSDLIEVPAIMPALKANSKKQLLQLLAERAAAISGIPEREVFDTILQRERLGSTGVGNGIAIPHGKLAGVKRITGVFARLETPVDFEALDDQPVDLVFLLLAPEGAGADHLKALSRIARVLRDADTVAKIRGTRDAAAIHALAVGYAGLARGLIGFFGRIGKGRLRCSAALFRLAAERQSCFPKIDARASGVMHCA